MNLYDCPDWAAIERRHDADRFGQMLSEQAESDAAQERMADSFLKLAAAGDADAAAAWAPQVNDYAKPFRQNHVRVLYPKRPATLAECMFEAPPSAPSNGSGKPCKPTPTSQSTS